VSVIHIPAMPRGRIDVFALDMGRADATAFVAPHPGTDDPARAWPLRAALGADFLDAGGIELVSPGDLSAIGLSGYLAEGYGADPAQLAPLSAVLDAIGRPVLLVRGRAFGGMAQTLSVGAGLRHVATLHEIQATPAGPGLQSSSALPQAAEDDAPAASGPGHRPPGAPVALIAGSLGLAALLVVALRVLIG